ncbi:MAG: MBL fold metallo-hydrolase [Fibrobacterota bacterium]
MKITFTGTGAAGGVPLYGCSCPHCRAAHREAALKRRPASLCIETESTRLLIDAGRMDFADRFPAGTFSGILLTHFHTDHVQGLFHIRWGRETSVPVFSPEDPQGCADLYRHPGILSFQFCDAFIPQHCGDIQFFPIPLRHSKTTFGYILRYRSACCAYLCDTGPLSPESLSCIAGLKPDLLVIDCTTAATGSPNHHSLETVMKDIAAINPPKTLLSHVGHNLSASLWNGTVQLPPNVSAAQDEMEILL